MIYYLYGENTVERDQQIAAILNDMTAESMYGIDLTLTDLQTIFSGQSLFGVQAYIITDPQYASIRPELVSHLENGTDNTVIFVELHPDKRTTLHKALVKRAKAVACDWPQVGQKPGVTNWLVQYAQDRQVSIDHQLASTMVDHAVRLDDKSQKPIIDQQLLVTAVSQFAGQTDLNQSHIETVMPRSLDSNVFDLLEIALSGDIHKVDKKLAELRRSEDPHRLMALLASQLVNVVAAVTLPQDMSIDEAAKRMAVHPYAMRSSQKSAQKISVEQMKSVLEYTAAADIALKTSSSDPWQVVGTMLHKIAHIKNVA